jgi:hypothetical protein
MTENQHDQRNGTTSDTTAHLLRWITVAIAVAAFLLASSLSCELRDRFTNQHEIARPELTTP